LEVEEKKKKLEEVEKAYEAGGEVPEEKKKAEGFRGQGG
jgi:hypothetical protein